MFPFEKFPFSNFHDLNLDWILRKVKESSEIAEKAGDDVAKAKEDASTALKEAGEAKNAASAAQQGVQTAQDAATAAQDAAEAAQEAAEAAQRGEIPDGSINTVKIADGAITSVKIADGGIETVDLKDGSVTTPKIADLAVTTPKIGYRAVTAEKLAQGSVTYQKLDNSAKVVRLWLNSAPTSEFPSQQLTSFNMEPYTHYGIAYIFDLDDTEVGPIYGFVGPIPKSNKCLLCNIPWGGSLVTTRYFIPTHPNLFSVAKDTNDQKASNKTCVPYAIYGYTI